MIRSRWFVLLALIGVGQLQAGVFGEHKKMGDVAFLRFLAATPTARPVFTDLLQCAPFSGANAHLVPITTTTNPFLNALDYQGQLMLFEKEGMGITYGDLTGMSGDHSIDAFEVWRMFTTDWQQGSDAISLETDLNANFFAHLKEHFAAINAGARAADPFALSYILLAFEDESHFHAIDRTLRRELEDIDVVLMQQVFENMAADVGSVRADVVTRLFKTNVMAKHTILHALAMRLASVAGKLQHGPAAAALRPAAAKILRLALLMQAFSDHYLQDMFAAGHLVTHNQHAFFPYGLDQKAIHDHYNRIGVDVVIPATHATLHLMGDNSMEESTVDAGVTAVTASLTEMWSAYTTAVATGTSFDAGTWLAGHIAERDEPATYMSAFRYVPEPPVGQHRDSTVTFLYPRSGPYCGIGVGAMRQGDAYGALIDGFYGVGFPIVLPSDRSTGEQIIGGGFQFNGAYATGANLGTVMAGFDLWFWDRLHLQALGGWAVHEGWQGTGRIGVGYDHHPMDSRIGLRLMVGMQAYAQMQPMIGVMFSIVRY